MDLKQLGLLKKKLTDAGLDDDEWQNTLSNASDTCDCLAEMIEETEPYATNTVAHLRDSAQTLMAFSIEPE